MVLFKLRPSTWYLCPFKLFSGSPLFTTSVQTLTWHLRFTMILSQLTCPNLFRALPPNNSQLHPALTGLCLAHRYWLGITIYKCLLPLVPLTDIAPSIFPAFANPTPFSEIQAQLPSPQPPLYLQPGFCDLSLLVSCVFKPSDLGGRLDTIS